MPDRFDTPSPLLLTGQDGTRNNHFPAFFCANRKPTCRSKKRILPMLTQVKPLTAHDREEHKISFNSRRLHHLEDWAETEEVCCRVTLVSANEIRWVGN